MKKVITVILALCMLFITACSGGEIKYYKTDTDQLAMPAEGEEIAIITTDKGVMYMRLFPEDAPKAVENFKLLSQNGYYNGLLFHRVIANYLVQTGDPNGDGTGGNDAWGGKFTMEISKTLYHYKGAVGMARSEAYDSQGSQFYIIARGYASVGTVKTMKELGQTEVAENYETYGGAPEFDGEYSIFGQIFAGYTVLNDLSYAETDDNDKPVEDEKIVSIEFKDYYEGLVPTEAFDR